MDNKPTFRNYDPEIRDYLLSQYVGFKGLAHVMKSKKACLIGSLQNYLIFTTADTDEFYMRGRKAFENWK